MTCYLLHLHSLSQGFLKADQAAVRFLSNIRQLLGAHRDVFRYSRVKVLFARYQMMASV